MLTVVVVVARHRDRLLDGVGLRDLEVEVGRLRPLGRVNRLGLLLGVGVRDLRVAHALSVTRFVERVCQVISALPPGTVVTYGEVAEEAGRPGAARAVGHVLATTEGLPWWRVVTATGRLVPGNEAEHERRLVAEGARVVGGRVRAKTQR